MSLGFVQATLLRLIVKTTKGECEGEGGRGTEGGERELGGGGGGMLEIRPTHSFPPILC